MSVLRKRKMMIATGPDLSKFEGEDSIGESVCPSPLELFLTLIDALFCSLPDKNLKHPNPEPLFMADPESDKENQRTPVPFNKKHRSNASLPPTVSSVPPSSTVAVSPTFVLDPNSPLAANTPTLPCPPKSAISNAAATPAFILDPTSALVSTTQIRPPLPFRPTLIANNVTTAPFPHIKQEPRHVMLSISISYS